ncbi:hypothetical protein [Mesorhizobium sp. YR577]|uniref:hypothetical protein n=1 Tax=Mesorhizobium sp. YR577 TaxID=1884373 RepID=UPI0008E9C4A8|nr:hypothetical protein [Mesorhizobium sp. YR577]SFU21548.1 hypothetical protein SAMN05518861_12764 [Mesorhizobium sp. YR577]
MAYAESKIDGRKGRRAENKAETGKSSAGRAEDTLNFTLTAGALGLGIALLDRDQANAADATSTTDFAQDDDRLSATFSNARQAESGGGRSAIAEDVVHDSGHDAPNATSNVQVDHQAADSADSERGAEILQQPPEAAGSQIAELESNNTEDSIQDAAMPSADPAIGTSVSNSGAGGAIAETHDRSSLAGPGEMVVDIMPGDTPAERMVEAVHDIASNLLGSDGLLGVVPDLTEAVGGLVDKDGALGALTDGDGSALLDALIGDDGLLGALTNGDADVIDALVSTGGVVGAVTGGNGNVLDSLVGTGSVIGAVTGGNEDVLDGLVGTEGVVGAVTGGNGDVLGDLVGENGLLGGLGSTEGGASLADAAAEDAVETAAPPETTAADTSETPSNVFDVANVALQITEYVADALTPTLKFVGQPILETDAHMDTDHSSLTQHAA